MEVQEANELLDAVSSLLVFMDEEVYAERMTLAFNDAWADVEHIARLLEVLNG